MPARSGRLESVHRSYPRRHAGRRIEVGATATDDTVALTVDGDCPGVPEPMRARIFEPFVMTKAPQEGTGLGLFLCRRFVEDAGGTIDAGRARA